MFGTWGLNHPDIGQAACGRLLSLFDSLRCWYSFVILLNLFSGLVDYNRARVGGAILITEGQTSSFLKYMEGKSRLNSVLWRGEMCSHGISWHHWVFSSWFNEKVYEKKALFMSFGCYDSRAIFSCQNMQNNPGAKWLQMVDHSIWSRAWG